MPFQKVGLHLKGLNINAVHNGKLLSPKVCCLQLKVADTEWSFFFKNQAALKIIMDRSALAVSIDY